MKPMLPAVFTLVCGLFMAALPVAAHHSFNAQFDPNKKITLQGTVTKVEWENPHIYFFVDVTSETGQVANWTIEGPSPSGLLRNGGKKDTLKPGDAITIECFPARDGSNLANMIAVSRDGKRVLGRTQYPSVVR